MLLFLVLFDLASLTPLAPLTLPYVCGEAGTTSHAWRSLGNGTGVVVALSRRGAVLCWIGGGLIASVFCFVLFCFS